MTHVIGWENWDRKRLADLERHSWGREGVGNCGVGV
jgi:hypothetical protein